MKRYPLRLLIVVIDRDKSKIVEKAFDDFSIVEKTTLVARGTAATALGDIFNFGIIDRDIICAIVEENRLNLVTEKLDNIIDFQEKGLALRFCVPISAISSDLFKLLNLNLGGKNENKN